MTSQVLCIDKYIKHYGSTRRRTMTAEKPKIKVTLSKFEEILEDALYSKNLCKLAGIAYAALTKKDIEIMKKYLTTEMYEIKENKISNIQY